MTQVCSKALSTVPICWFSFFTHWVGNGLNWEWCSLKWNQETYSRSPKDSIGCSWLQFFWSTELFQVDMEPTSRYSKFTWIWCFQKRNKVWKQPISQNDVWCSNGGSRAFIKDYRDFDKSRRYYLTQKSKSLMIVKLWLDTYQKYLNGEIDRFQIEKELKPNLIGTRNVWFIVQSESLKYSDRRQASIVQP